MSNIKIQKVEYDVQYIADIIDDVLSAEDRANTEENRLDAMNFLHNTTYLADIDEENAQCK